ncbi:MAG: hypothetical protein J7J16_02440, partial [Deltaproteobacteria bacterium]|nr:hypothetical protein [Deltaproteobacteria bacterium]
MKKKSFISNKTKQSPESNVVGTVKEVNYRQIDTQGLKYVLRTKEMKIYKGDRYLLYDVELKHPTKK